MNGARTAVTAALLAGLCLAAPARAEQSVEFFDRDGRRDRVEERFYTDRRALVIAAPDEGEEAGRGALEAWLAARDFEIERVAPDAGTTPEAIADRLVQYGRDGTLAIVVIDAALERVDGRDVAVFRTGEGEVSLPFAPLLDLVDRRGPQHVLVATTAPVVGSWELSLRREETDDRPLSSEAEREARLLMSPERHGDRDAALAALGAGLRGDLGAAFDSDGHVTAADAARAATDVALDSFGRDDGMVVLGTHQRFEREIGRAGPTRREVFADLPGSRDIAAFDAFIETYGTGHRDGRWAALRREALIALAARETRRFCGQRLDIEPRLVMRLGLSSVSHLPAFAGAGDLASAWLDDLEAATGRDPRDAEALVERCRDVADEPDLALALALGTLVAGGDPVLLQETLRRSIFEDEVPEAAVLAGLAALAARERGTDDERALRSLESLAEDGLDRAEKSGSAAAALVAALHTLAERIDNQDDAERAMRRAKLLLRQAVEDGHGLARGVYGVLALTDHPLAARLGAQGARLDLALGLDSLRLAERQGLTIDERLIARDAVENEYARQRVQQCGRVLDFDPVVLFDPWTIANQRDFEDLFAQPGRFAERRFAGALPRAWARDCVEAVEDDALEEGLALRIAVAALASGRADLAETALARTGGDGLGRFLRAARTAPRDRAASAAVLADLAARGDPLAALYLPVIARDGEHAQAARGNLDRLAERAMPAALFLSSILAAREDRPEDSVAAYGYALAAKNAGFELAADSEAAIAEMASQALPGLLGLDLRRLADADARRLGVPGLSGGIVVAGTEGPLYEGAVIDRITSLLDRDFRSSLRELLDEMVGQDGVRVFFRGVPGKRSEILPVPEPVAKALAPAQRRPEDSRVVLSASQEAELYAGPGGIFRTIGGTTPGREMTRPPQVDGGVWVRVALQRDGRRVEGYVRRGALAGR
ncbi:MAG: hypothetical protein ACFBWO_18885 [Paracoccaceae bacterium]